MSFIQIKNELVNQVKPENSNNVPIQNLILKFDLEYIFTPKTLKERIHDKIFYCSYNPFWLPEDKVSVFRVLGIYNFEPMSSFVA